MSTCDVLVVGAGVAGLSAAKAARSKGLKTVVIEAKGRVGGRAFTEEAMLGTAIDHGAHFLHRASQNPFRDYADSNGFNYKKGGYETRIFNGRWFSQKARTEFESFAKGALTEISRGADHENTLSSYQVLSKSELRSCAKPELLSLFEGYYEEFLGASGLLVAAAEHARYLDTFEDWPVEQGFGTLVRHFGADIPVITDCPVREIDYTGKEVRTLTAKGEVVARTVIVAVSTGVLASEQIRFKPGLPLEKLRALDGVPMGYAGKVAFRLEGKALSNVPSHHGLITTPDGYFANLHIRPFEKPVAVAIVGGSQWEMVERCGPGAMVELGRVLIHDVYGVDAVRDLGQSLATNWLTDLHVLGGHSFMRTGYGSARQALAAPINDRVFFAGEATSLESWATVHGAYASGSRAIEQVSSALTKNSNQIEHN